jgi:hypothetical protein
LLDNDGTHAYERRVRIFAFHAVRNPPATLNHASDSKRNCLIGSSFQISAPGCG